MASLREPTAERAGGVEPPLIPKLQSLIQDKPSNKVPVPGEYDRGQLLLAVIDDAVKHAVSTGMGAKDVNNFFTIFTTVLESIIQKGGNVCSLENSASVLKDCLLAHSPPMSHTASHNTASYISRTLLQHFNLYHYLLNHHQPEWHTLVQMSIETPDKNQLAPLMEGMVESEWEKKEKVKQIEECRALNERILRNEREEFVKKQNSEIAKLEEEVFSSLTAKAACGMSESEIKDMTASLVEARVRQFLGSLSYEMSQQEGSVGVRVESLGVQQAEPRETGSSTPSSKKGKQSTHNKSPASSGRTSGRNV